MLFSKSKRILLGSQKEKYTSTFFLALLTASVMFLPYIFMGEGYFLFYGDFNVQQVPFYQMCHKAIREGNVGWNWLTDLGANFIGSYSFYLLGSPFFWLTIPFPNSFVPYLMGPLLIIKFACAALTAYCYIRRFTKTADAARLGGLLYAFSGFSVYNIFFNHFHEAIIIFPLLLLSLELLITENRRGIFALMVALSAISNYFFFFGMVVFCIIYFFVRLFSGAIKVRFSRFLVLLLEAVIGLLLSAVLLLPALMAIIDNSRLGNMQLGWNAIVYGKEQIYLNIIECFFFPPDLPARPVFFPGANVKWSSLGGWLPVFSMVGVFALFINKKVSWLRRTIGICAFMAMVPVLNSAFYAFNTSYYARWFYMPILMMCLATVMLTEDSSVEWRGAWRWVLGITIGFALTIGLFPQKNKQGDIIFGLYTQDESGMYIFRFWLTVAIAIFGLVLLRALLLQLKERNFKAFYRSSVAVVCLVAMIYGCIFIGLGKTHSYDVKEVMIDKLIEGNVELPQGDNYRVDVYDGVDNTAMYLELPTINAFHSVVPASIMEFYEFVGEERDVASRPEPENYALRPLLSVKYILNRTDGEGFMDDQTGDMQMPGYSYYKTSGGYYIYENENYIPYGFSYDYYMTEEFCSEYSESMRAQLMLKAIILNDEQIKKYGTYMQDLGKLEYNFDEEYDGINLKFDDEAIAADSARLAKTAATQFDITNNGFSATVQREGKSLVFFSVPYDEGWSATVDGKAVEIEKVNIGFMAVEVEGGKSNIEFTYKTPGLVNGILITAGTLIFFGVYLLLSFIWLRGGTDNNDYPEGEELLGAWKKEEIFMEAIIHEEKPEEYDLFDTPIDIPQINEGFSGGFKIIQEEDE